MMKKTICFLLMFVLLLVPVTAYAGTPAADSVRILNAAKLTPQVTGNDRLDAKVASLLAEFRKTAKDTYGLVKACYDYLIANTAYPVSKEPMFLPYDLQTNGSMPPLIIVGALELFDTGFGVCDQYTAAFVVMARAIGLEAFNFGGDTRTVSGGFTPHAWAEICIDGVFYIFDAQLEDSVANGGDVRYIYFCKTEKEMEARYKWDKEYNDWYVEAYRYNAPLGVLKVQAPPSLDNIRILYNGEEVVCYNPPVYEPGDGKTPGRVLVPVRVVEAFGAKVEWVPSVQLVGIFYKGIEMGMFIDDPVVFVGEDAALLDVPPRIVNKTTLVPVRFVSETFGKDVQWDGANFTVVITDKE